MTLAMMLLAGAGLLVRSFARLSQVDPGFRTESALGFRVSLAETVYDTNARRAAFFGLPLGGTRFNLSFQIAGRTPVPPAKQATMELRGATPDYFKTMGIPVPRGRGFLAGDVRGGPQVVRS